LGCCPFLNHPFSPPVFNPFMPLFQDSRPFSKRPVNPLVTLFLFFHDLIWDSVMFKSNSSLTSFANSLLYKPLTFFFTLSSCSSVKILILGLGLLGNLPLTMLWFFFIEHIAPTDLFVLNFSLNKSAISSLYRPFAILFT